MGYVAEVVEIIRQVAEAADALHEAGIVHRDIKPGNIMVGRDGKTPVLMDLGLAQLVDESEGSADPDAAVRRHAALREPGAGPGCDARRSS